MAIKDIHFVHVNFLSMYDLFQLHPPYDFSEDFYIFFQNFMLPWQPIKISDSDESHVNHGGLPNNIPV